MKNIVFIILLVCLLPSSLLSQGYQQYNHYIANQGLLNPAYNGTRDVISGLMTHRSQWISMEGAPMNQAINVHGPVEDTNIGLGVVLQNDAIGFSNTFDAMVAASYKIELDNRGKRWVSLGLQAGVTSFIFDGTKAITGDWNDPVFQGRTSTVGFNTGFGAYYYATDYFVGFSIPKMLSQSFDENTNEFKNKFDFQNMAMFLYGGYVFDWEPVKVKPTLLFREVYGAPLQFDVSCNVLLAETIWVGMSYRSTSNIVFLSEFILNRQFTLRYSFDYALNSLNQFSQYGSHEIGLQFDFSFNKRPGMRSIRYF
ncbi:PorP/SprF family type IX secretion system membrane protein [Saccharicrinis aurantiacus]|uniref:PorP/SprF family type IX secretion system membrane protein n=1 Tax=Saccharicrinis aurantiacus TaxID=1849719 RepID=UPI002492FAAF|nr:type IX secretion system membrane protein PorP/SprF [Saccharicrinis aurantiacus]